MDLPGDSDLRSDPSPVAKFFRSVGVVSIKGHSFDTMTNHDPCCDHSITKGYLMPGHLTQPVDGSFLYVFYSFTWFE